jgi:hypothetical protein
MPALAPYTVASRPIKAIRPYEKNPRILPPEAIEAVARSILTLGFRQPIVVDSDGVIIAGHTRYRAALKLGLKDVPVHVADSLTPEQVKAYRIADNSTNALSAWDVDLLKLELSDLSEFDFSEFGLEEDELISEPMVGEDNFDLDAAVAKVKKPRTQSGDLWQLGRHRLLCGDSTNAEQVSQCLEDAPMQLCITDPPYALGDSYTRKNKYDVYIDSDDNLLRLIERFLPIAQQQCECVVVTCGNSNQYKYPPFLDDGMVYATGHWPRPMGFLLLATDIVLWQRSEAGARFRGSPRRCAGSFRFHFTPRC